MVANPDAADVDDQRLEFLDAPTHPSVVALNDYWNEKRAGRAMPDRRDISPAHIVPFLPNILLSEVVDGGRDFRLRIFGTSLVALIGKEMTGKLLSEITGDPRLLVRPTAAQHRTLAVISAAYKARRPVFASGRLINTVHRSLEWHSFSSPMTVGGEEIGQMLGALFVVERSAS